MAALNLTDAFAVQNLVAAAGINRTVARQRCIWYACGGRAALGAAQTAVIGGSRERCRFCLG